MGLRGHATDGVPVRVRTPCHRGRVARAGIAEAGTTTHRACARSGPRSDGELGWGVARASSRARAASRRRPSALGGATRAGAVAGAVPAHARGAAAGLAAAGAGDRVSVLSSTGTVARPRGRGLTGARGAAGGLHPRHDRRERPRRVFRSERGGGPTPREARRCSLSAAGARGGIPSAPTGCCPRRTRPTTWFFPAPPRSSTREGLARCPRVCWRASRCSSCPTPTTSSITPGAPSGSAWPGASRAEATEQQPSAAPSQECSATRP